LNGEGLPYVLEESKTVGAFSSAEQFGEGKRWMAATTEQHDLEFPTAFSVVEFP
jgi:hypothetical protein